MNGDLTRFRQTIRSFVIIGVCSSDLACGGIIRDIRRSRILLQQRIGLVACRDELFPARIGISALLRSGEHGVQLSDIRSGIVRAFQIVLADKTAQCRPDRRECGRKRFVCDRIVRLIFVRSVRTPVPCARCDGTGFAVRLIQSVQQSIRAGHRVLKRLPARSRIICLLQRKLRFDIVALFCLGIAAEKFIEFRCVNILLGNQITDCSFKSRYRVLVFQIFYSVIDCALRRTWVFIDIFCRFDYTLHFCPKSCFTTQVPTVILIIFRIIICFGGEIQRIQSIFK